MSEDPAQSNSHFFWGELENSELPPLKRLAQSLGPEAIATLADIMRDASQPAGERIKAADHILTRGHGKPETNMTMQSVNVDISSAHLSALQAHIRTRRAISVDLDD